MLIKDGVLSDVSIDGVKFISDIIPKGRIRRPAIKMNPAYITIHNTGCPDVPADNFRRSVLDIKQDMTVSWHFTVDENTIIQHLPIDEVAWHSGTEKGNYTSIGIEVCERTGSEEAAVKFTSLLLSKLKMPISNVRPHKYWSGKECPRLILKHWDRFIVNVNNYNNSTMDLELVKACDTIHKLGVISSVDFWCDVNKINVSYTKELMRKYCKVAYKKDVCCYDNALVLLCKNGVITELDKWIYEDKITSQSVKYLIIKMAKEME